MAHNRAYAAGEWKVEVRLISHDHSDFRLPEFKNANMALADPMTRALIHRYAHALMLVDFDCTQTFGCACSGIDRALNAPPIEHS
jgi:hypothetical protein